MQGTATGKRKKIIIAVMILAAVAVCCLVIFLVRRRAGTDSSSSDDTVYDSSDVPSEVSNYYSGVVEPVNSWDITRDSDRELKEIYVKEGDSVKVGQQLFAYKTEDVSLQVQQANLELQDYDSQIAGVQTQINQLNSQMAAAPADQKLEYSSQLTDLNSQLKQLQLNKKIKQAEIDNLNKKVSDSVVTSKIDGVVKKINNSSDSTGAFMTILSTDQYRVKASVDENNVSSLSEGQSVVIHSRTNQDQTWTGKIAQIRKDTTENASSSDDSSYLTDGSSDSETQTATKYPVYITLDSSDGLLIGQHVYVEPVFDDSGDGTGDVSTDASDASAGATGDAQ